WITKTVSGGDQIGEHLDYVLTIGNDGPGAALGPISVTDVVPAALPVVGVAGSSWDCTYLHQTVQCWLTGDLEAGASATIVVTTEIGPSASGNIVNRANVDSDGPVVEADLTDNTDTVAVSIGELPRTGADLLRFAVVGLLLLLAGAGLVTLTVRRERSYAFISSRHRSHGPTTGSRS
ncbi:MAG: DUF11 domain-containing protein, partial [Acidimicrobiia bacterium]|nr:DUF11 domain-containing protein [Acidimicrobiia bacterium]